MFSARNSLLIGVIAICLIAAGVLYFRDKSTGTFLNGGSTATQQRPLLTYYDPRYGVAFNFPDNYAVKDHDSTSGAKHHTIVIGDKNELSSTTPNSEGPMVMTMDIYDNPSKQAADKWIKNNDFSNYKLSQNAPLSTTTVAGIPAYAYPWDGLYKSLSIVFPENGKMYMLSVNYNSTSDQLYKDFAGVVASIQFDQ
jgi:hypothetical protein